MESGEVDDDPCANSGHRHEEKGLHGSPGAHDDGIFGAFLCILLSGLRRGGEGRGGLVGCFSRRCRDRDERQRPACGAVAPRTSGSLVFHGLYGHRHILGAGLRFGRETAVKASCLKRW